LQSLGVQRLFALCGCVGVCGLLLFWLCFGVTSLFGCFPLPVRLWEESIFVHYSMFWRVVEVDVRQSIPDNITT
jgi:hypothetical protein